MAEEWVNYGEVYTRRWVVESLLDLVGYDPVFDLGAKVLVEPSIGSGAFLIPAVERLLESAKNHSRAPESLMKAIRGYDLVSESVEQTKRAVERVLEKSGIEATLRKALAESWLIEGDFLLAMDVPRADFVVGNPPYIRLEDVPKPVMAKYRETWPTMRGRADIYVGFYERGLRILDKSGVLGFICADRFMRNQYGAQLRRFIASKYSVDHVWVMHEVDAFESSVSAYPAITVISNQPQGLAVVAQMSSQFAASSAQELLQVTQTKSVGEFVGLGYQGYVMPSWFEGEDLWPSGSPSLIALIEYLNQNFEPLSDSVKVGIGVASGADKTYVVKGAPVELDRLLPLAMVGDLRSDGSFEWQGFHLVNPWNENGVLVDLQAFPKLEAYLASSQKLRERHTAKKNPKQWYRTIDKVNNALIGLPKLLIQDMRSNINPVLEPGGFYPHHNLYYMTSDNWDLEVLGGILISRIGQGFVEAYGVRMRGGTLRFQSQYLRKIKLPIFSEVDKEVANLLRVAFRSRDVKSATHAAALAYRIDPLEYPFLQTDR